jgi:putative CocE/NonD family hydrolase
MLTLPLLLALFGPTLLLHWQSRGSNDELAFVVIGTVVLQTVQLVIVYMTLVRPLKAEARPGSSFAFRTACIYAMRACQVVISLLCSGPLKLVFLGKDPLCIIEMLEDVSRNLDAKILHVRPPQYRIRSQGRHLFIPLRDGVETAATLYSPLSSNGAFDDSPRPVVLVRTPYSRDSVAPWGARFAERGYHLVAQDTRGRFGSTGDFFPMLNEAEDGAATIEWLEQQPWCNGSIGITGVSYLGLASWAAMREQVPALKAVAPILAATDLHHVMFGRNGQGAAHVELMFRWSYLVIHLMTKPFGMLESIFTFFRGTGTALTQAYMHAPLYEVDTKFLCPNITEPLEWFQDAFEHPLGTEDFWHGKKKFVDFATLDRDKIPPVLLFAGWYDFFCTETLHDYQDLSKISDDCRLVVGPYTHWCIMSMQPKLFRSLFDFFDKHLLKDGSAKDLANVEAFCMGNDMKWHALNSWPPAHVVNREFVLALTNVGDGEDELVMLENDDNTETIDESSLEYVYDPADPTPQIGGSTFNPTNCGRLPQNQVEKRNDVLVFTSKPLSEQMTIAGQIQVNLIVVSNVKGTDYVARACHVTANGTSENIADGIVRRFNLEPGIPTRIDMILSPVMNKLPAGDRLRLHVCSSAFPKHGRHLNTSDSFHLAVEPKLSRQQVILGGDKGSHIVVPTLD